MAKGHFATCCDPSCHSRRPITTSACLAAQPVLARGHVTNISAMASSIFNRLRHIRPSLPVAGGAVLTLTTTIWVTDSFCSLHRVKGESMEPALMDGDIILVRRSDIMPWRSKQQDEATIREYNRSRSSADENNENSTFNSATTTVINDAKERQRIRQIDASWGCHHPESLIYTPSAPLMLAGDVAIFASPNYYPVRYAVKRIVSTGQHRIRPTDALRNVETVPADCVWVEGDNKDKSEDSRDYGPLSKRLLVGKVERILWPPSKWGRMIERKKPPPGRVWPMNFIDDDEDDYNWV